MPFAIHMVQLLCARHKALSGRSLNTATLLQKDLWKSYSGQGYRTAWKTGKRFEVSLSPGKRGNRPSEVLLHISGNATTKELARRETSRIDNLVGSRVPHVSVLHLGFDSVFLRRVPHPCGFGFCKGGVVLFRFWTSRLCRCIVSNGFQ
jgi:hypothetical protein